MTVAPPDTTSLQRSLRGWPLASVLIALMLTLLLEALDQTVVGTALPKIIGSLQGFDRYTWVVTAYLLGSTTMIPIIGKVSDQFGRKLFLIAGVILFLLGSALCGAAQTMDQLIAFRALQGLGAGVGIALIFTVVGDIFTPQERARWQGIFAAVYGFSSVFGPTIGGTLADHGPLLSGFITDQSRWRWVFYVNLPIGIIALAALLIYLPRTRRTGAARGWAALRRVDFPGALLVAGGTICLLLGLSWGSDQTYAWNSPQVIIILAGAAVLYAAFIVVEQFVAEPILPLRLLRRQVVAADAILTLGAGMTLLPLVIYLPLFMQGILGVSATYSGEAITPMSISLVVGAAIAGIFVARLQRYQAIAITAGVILALGIFLLTRLTSASTVAVAIGCMIVAGLGQGMFFSLSTLVMQNAVPRADLGVGTALARYVQALGQTIGLAIAGTVVNHTLSTDLATRISPADQAQWTAQGLKFATDPQVLTNPAYRQMVITTHERIAVAFATQNVPPGPTHDQTVATITQQTIQQADALSQRTFAAVKAALEGAIIHGFVTVLIFSALIIAATLFLKDLPFGQVRPAEHTKTSEENTPMAAEIV